MRFVQINHPAQAPALREHTRPLRTHLAYILVMWALIGLYLLPVVLAGRVLAPYDILYQSYEPWRSELGSVASAESITFVSNTLSADALFTSLPLAAIAQRQLRAGELPIWDPNTLTGFPIGGFVTPYPPQLLAYMLLPPDLALTWVAVGHLLLLSLFAYLLTTSLGAHPLGGIVAGLASALNSMVLFYAILPISLPTITWVLSIFWALTRFASTGKWRWTAVAGLCYGMLALAGNGQMLLYASLAYGLYVVGLMGQSLLRRWLRHAGALFVHSAAMVLLGLIIGAPYFWYTIQLLAESSRSGGGGTIYSITEPKYLIQLLVPLFWGNYSPMGLTPAAPSVSRMSIGLLPLGLALISLFSVRRLETYLFASIALVCIAITLGIQPFVAIFYALLSPVATMDHTRLLIPASLFLAINAGLGVHTVLESHATRRHTAWLFIGLALILCELWVAAAVRGPSAPNLLAYYNLRQIGVVAALGLSFAAGLLFTRWPIIRPWLGKALLLGLISAELIGSFWRFHPIFTAGLMQPPPMIKRLAELVHQNHFPPARVYQIGIGGPLPQLLNYFDIPDIAGYTSLPFERYQRYTFESEGRIGGTMYWDLAVAFSGHQLPRINALGAEYLLVARDFVAPPDYRTPLAPEIPREVLPLRGTELSVLPAGISPTLDLTIDVPVQARSYVMAGVVALAGEVEYTATVNGVIQEQHTLSVGPGGAYWAPLALDLTPLAGQRASVRIEVREGIGAIWRLTDPQLHVNPNSNPMLLVDAGGMLVYQNTQAFPRAWLVYNIAAVAPSDLDAVSVALADVSLDLRQTAVVEAAAPPALGAPHPQDTLEITRYDPTRVEVQVSVAEPALLVVPDIYTSLWRAHLDGVETNIYPTNMMMRGVVVPAGAHTIKFSFNVMPFYASTLISLLISVLLLMMAAADGLGFRRIFQ